MPTYGDSILGNFLSGMETGIRGDDRVPLRALETSLVEWKLPFGGREQGRGDALETSLVEWKLDSRVAKDLCAVALGNFLSGMETHPQSAPGRVPATPWKLP